VFQALLALTWADIAAKVARSGSGTLSTVPVGFWAPIGPGLAAGAVPASIPGGVLAARFWPLPAATNRLP
jgi:hypothetical protein